MTKEHLLVVEDEGDILELLRYNLAREGFRVTGVVSWGGGGHRGGLGDRGWIFFP